jgi:hypothetical protein
MAGETAAIQLSRQLTSKIDEAIANLRKIDDSTDAIQKFEDVNEIIARSSEDPDINVDDGLFGLVVWANVSKAVDEEIRAQIATRTYPVELDREDWRSGDIHWLLDVIALNEAAAHKVIAGLGDVIRAKELHVHPRVQLLLKNFPTMAGKKLP